MSKSRNVLLAVALGASAAIASAAVSAGSPVEERQATMKQVGQTMKQATAFTAAQTPYDAAKVAGLMDGLAADAKKLKGLYPAGSDKDPKSEALPAVWSNKADFEKKLADMGEAAEKAGKATDQASFQTAFKAVGTTCAACHNTYRKKQS